MMQNEYEVTEQALANEMNTIEQKLKNGEKLTMDMLKEIEMISHSMKSLAGYKKLMCELEEDGYFEGMSGRRGRNPMNGRYVSRDGGNSYADGYSAGYSEGMRMSGHYPMPGDMLPPRFR